MKRFKIGVLVAALLALLIPAVPQAQSVVTAQILDFWRLLSIGGTFSGESLEYFTLAIQANGYANFGNLRGTTGYGIRDNAGVIEFKNSGGAWAAASGGASPTATYLVKTATGAPVNAQIMGALGSGLVFNTTTTGVQSIYGGTTCTNQFPRSLSAAGAATCQSVNVGTDVTGTLAASAFPILTGDVTTAGGTLTTVLSTTGVGAASLGSTTRIPTFTVDAKGRLTAASQVAPQLTLTSTYFSSLSGASLTGVPTSALTGTLAAGQFPALTGDVTTTAGSLATTVAKIGGNAVSLAGALTFSGANPVTFTSTGSTTVTLPTTGTLLTNTVTSLTSLAAVGTLTTGVWNATPVTPQYGGTGLATVTAHGIVVGNGTGTMAVVAGCTNGVLDWTASSSDPTCTTSPIVGNAGATTSHILGGTAVSGGAATSYRFTKLVTALSDATATPLVTITVPNAAEGAVVHVRLIGSIGAGGAVGAFECTANLEGAISVARTSGLATVATAATAAQTSSACVAGATTITLAYAVSAMTGANSATQTFTINGTITKGGGGSSNHQALIEVDILNNQTTGVTGA